MRSYEATYILGYRVNDLRRVLPPGRQMRVGSSVGGRVWGKDRVRMARSLGFHLVGAAPLIPDVQDLETSCRGAQHRFLRDTPKPSRKVMRRFRGFVRMWVRMNLEPLSFDSDISVASWLDGTSYSVARKNELLEHEGVAYHKRFLRNKMFRKRECYFEPKHARQINSRHDWFKTRTGPIFKLIEHELFKRPEFIKTVPVAERAEYMHQMLYRVGATYLETDHTSFEAHMSGEIMRVCEMQLYSYMVRNLPDKDWFPLVLKGLCSEQNCYSSNRYGYQSARGQARMSGDMCTSLGNGFTNLMVMKFIAQELGWSECVGVVEGDDGLFRIAGPIPTEQDFASVGFTIKAQVSDSIGRAGFCHLYNVEGQNENLVDPISTAIKIGWTLSPQMHGGRAVMNKLARAKAMSLVCEAPANPITAAIGLSMLRVTHGNTVLDPYDPDRWWNEQCLHNIDHCIARAKRGPTIEQRLFVEEKWGVSVADQQHIEAWFSKQSRIVPISDPVLLKYVPKWPSFSYDTFIDIAKKGHSWRS